MIVSFYDETFRGLQNNASLVIDTKSYKLIKRPVEMNELSCICEPFTENIQPTFLVISDDRGRYIYGSLAGIPLLNNNNQTEINGTDIKSMLSSDVILETGTYTSVNEIIRYIFNQWNTQVNQNSFNCELLFNDNVGTIQIGDLTAQYTKGVYNAWEEMQSYLKYYDLYLDTKIDLVNKKVQFIVGKTMLTKLNIKLWEYGIKNYGKWIADVNECQGYYVNEETNTWTNGEKWILTSNNNITVTESNRDIYPIKRRIITSNESLLDANIQALEVLLNALYNENIEIPTDTIQPDFETRFDVYVNKGEFYGYFVENGTDYFAEDDFNLELKLGTLNTYAIMEYVNDIYGKITINNKSYLVSFSKAKHKPYKFLPCGELHYDASGLTKVQIGYRYTGVQFI